MPSLAFDMTTANHLARRYEFRGKNNADYYEGELKPLPCREVDMRIEKSAAGEYSIYRLTSKGGLAFRRSWPHIRADKTSVTVFWFVRRGTITISHPGEKHAVHVNECAITRSSRPFYMELMPDEGGLLDVMHVVVPSHKLYAVISENLEIGRPFPTSRGDLHLAERVFSFLFEEDETIDPDIAEQLVSTLLDGVGRSISRISGMPAPRASIADRRVADITRYIGQHFANSDLNAKMVSGACNISLRYLCHILKNNQLSFSSLVWDMRMETAHRWLKDEKMRHYSICEIAYLVGFKSSAHFSRMFKSRYEMSPRAFRLMQSAEGSA